MNFLNEKPCFKCKNNRKRKLAGLSGTRCVCSNAPDFIELEKGTVGRCNYSCSANINETCGGFKSYDTFFIAKACKIGKLV